MELLKKQFNLSEESKKFCCLLLAIGIATFSITYFIVVKEENRKAEEKAKTEIVFKHVISE